MYARNGHASRRNPLLTLLPVLLVFLMVGVLAACQSGGAPAVEQPAAETPAEEAEQTVEEPVAETESAAEEEEPAAESESETEDEAAPAALKTFAIVSDGSEARFLINEVLFGNDKTVVGVTSDVTGELRLDPADPGASEIGPITINARDITTDADRRNGAIRRFILQSDQDANQYITFTPTGIEGMPEAVTVGEAFEFQINGDLAIRDVVRPETFDVSVTPNSESEISGLATTTVLYPDYELTIPEVPSVTGVEDEVQLEFEFTAVTQ